MAPATVWLSLRNVDERVYLEHSVESWQTLQLPAIAQPSLIVLFGHRKKSTFLKSLCNDEGADSPHGQALLQRDGSGSNIFVDFELDVVAPSTRSREACSVTRQKLKWMNGSHFSRYNIANLVVSRVLSCFADVVCYFAADLGGLPGVALLLAEQIVSSETDRSDMHHNSLPCILVVCETRSRSFKLDRTRSKLGRLVEARMRTQHHKSVPGRQVLDWIESKIGSIAIVGVPSDQEPFGRKQALRTTLHRLQGGVLRDKAAHGCRFRRDHLYSLIEQSVCQFCDNYTQPFSFARASRPVGFNVGLSTYSVVHFLDLEDQRTITRASDRQYMGDNILDKGLNHRFQHAIIASSIMLACYPPESHIFPMPWLYEQLFEPSLHEALSQKLHSTEQVVFDQEIGTYLTELYETLITGKYKTGKQVHAATLVQYRDDLKTIHTNAVCLSCLLNTPERLLSCGHSICDNCIRIWSQPTYGDAHAFQLGECPFCGASQTQVFRLLPPTAGIRLLSLDGGGIKGIVPLVILSQIERELCSFGVPLRDYFDFVCGTSAGGLIALGLFVMEWPTFYCLHMFKTLAKKTFTCSAKGFSTLGRLQELIISYLRDYRYSSVPIEHAFRTTFGADGEMREQYMFRSVCNGARVAVTTTITAEKPQACLLSNYNGGSRQERRSYKLIRPLELEEGVSVAQAARATSAAPWLFAPVDIAGVGLCQDGGLHHNNPILLADWEARAMWPERGLRDFDLTIGTGFSEGIIRPRPGFVRRLVDSIMHNMDGEKIHEEYMNSKSMRERERIKRLNVDLGCPEPMLHDARAMAQIEEKTTNYLRLGSDLKEVTDLALSSMFCFELDCLPSRYSKNGANFWQCSGHVFCRLPMPVSGRSKLCQTLKSTQSFFLVSEICSPSATDECLGPDKEPQMVGQPHTCIGNETKSTMPYRRWISFCLNSLDSQIGITVTGITSRPCSISGLPQSVRALIRAQGLVAPFGRSDHRTNKVLPIVPVKRHHHEISRN